MNYFNILLTLLPYMGYATAGIISNRIGISRGKPEKYLQFVLINVMFPVLAFNFIIGNPVMENFTKIASAPLVGFFSIVIGFAIGYYAAGFIGVKRVESVRSFAFTVGMYNYAFFSIPLTFALYGEDIVGVLLVHNLGNDIAVWSVGVGLLTGSGIYNPMRLLKNPPILAIITALTINFISGGAPMPETLKMITSTITKIAIPAGLFISGATLADNMGLFNNKDGRKIMRGSVALRMFVIPAIVVLLVSVLPIAREVKMVTAIQASMPAGMSTVVIVKYFSADAEASVPVIIATTLVSIFTMPLWISVFQMILL